MIITDTLCLRCFKPMRWAHQTPKLCHQCIVLHNLRAEQNRVTLFEPRPRTDLTR